MTPQEILELVRAGYTKEEISALTAPATPAEETPPAEEIVQSANTGAENLDTESVQDAQKPETVDYSKAIEELKNSIAQLTRTVQNNNLINKTTTQQAQVESVDDILKKLIN